MTTEYMPNSSTVALSLTNQTLYMKLGATSTKLLHVGKLKNMVDTQFEHPKTMYDLNRRKGLSDVSQKSGS